MTTGIKALAVFSGGLDSMLAASLIRQQGIDVKALFFETPFFSSKRARRSAHVIGVDFTVVDITPRHLQMLKAPPHGYGSNMNPCIDCHALMFRIAGEYLREEDAAFVISGEVLGQRPMSQNRKALDLVARECGLEGLLLRPLSAKLLPLSIPEERGWVDRQRLLALSGRSRKPQMALARSMGITDYPSPAGGCLLTDQVFSRRLKDLFNRHPESPLPYIEMLKVGRHFGLDKYDKLVVGRNRHENETIETLALPRDLVFKTVSIPGPSGVLHGAAQEKAIDLAAAIVAAYSDAKPGQTTRVLINSAEGSHLLDVTVPEKAAFRALMI